MCTVGSETEKKVKRGEREVKGEAIKSRVGEESQRRSTMQREDEQGEGRVEE
jgi:hypothetical protein